MAGKWVLLNPETQTIVASFATSQEAYEATYSDEWPEVVQVSFISDGV